MEPNTHRAIDPTLVGRAEVLGEGRARATLTTTAAMAADDRGLVHGGFVFGTVDYAAMAAVNDPMVVLGAADISFVAPVRVGDVVVADAEVQSSSGRKRVIGVRASVGDTEVLNGTLTAVVLSRHVLDVAKE